MRTASPPPCWILATAACAGLWAHSLFAGEQLTLSSSNTQVSFVVRRLGLSALVARFDELNGQIQLDPDGAASRVDVAVRMGSLDCGRDCTARLRSAQWLDVQHFPQMLYHSTHIQLEGHDRATVYGQLTLHGVTRGVELLAEHWSCAARHCNFQASARIRRSDYGLPHGFWVGGDEVDILIRGTAVSVEPLPDTRPPRS